MSETQQALEQLLADGWQPIAPPRAYAFGGQNDIRAVQIRLAMAGEPPVPLFEALKRLLWRDWDPLEVNTKPAAQAEYDGYAFRIWAALGRGASASQIETYLNGVTTGDMRADVAPGKNADIAKKAVALAKG
jgi:hypothetical protein